MDFNYTGAMQTFTAPSDGTYVIECWGASGGGPSRALCGLGAYTTATCKLKKGDIFKILVAGVGEWDGYRGGGGGGTFVELNNSTLLCAAAGGGGSIFSRTPNTFSHGQSGKYGGNYALSALLTGLNSPGRSDLASGTGGASYSVNSNWCYNDIPSFCAPIIAGATAFKNGGTGGYGTSGQNNGGYWADEIPASKGGFGGGGSASYYRCIGCAGGRYGYYYNGAGGGGGYSGGDSSRDSYANTAGGGGSYFIAGESSFAKAGYESMPTISDPNVTMVGNYGPGHVRIQLKTSIILTDGVSYYIPNKNYLKTDNSGFIPLNEQGLTDAVTNKVNIPCSIDAVNKPIVVENDTIVPSNILDFSKCKLCFISVNYLYKAKIDYTPSNTALLKTNIKVKKEYIQVSEGLPSLFVDITSPDKNKIDYFIDYNRDDQDNFRKLCGILKTEVLKYNFFLSLKLQATDSLLKSIGLFGKNNDKYTKLKNTSIDIYDNLKNKKFITFNSDHDEVIINKLTKRSLNYTIDSLDKF